MFRIFQFDSKQFESSIEISHYFELICIQFGNEMYFKLENPNFIGDNSIQLKTDNTEKTCGACACCKITLTN